jgi:hypothetical protein
MFYLIHECNNALLQYPSTLEHSLGQFEMTKVEVKFECTDRRTLERVGSSRRDT